MASVWEGLLATKAAPKPVPLAKTVVVNAAKVDVKPASLDVGQVQKVESGGKVTYYVGTASGGVASVKTAAKAEKKVNTEIKIEENTQKTALVTAQKIEVSELKQQLKADGLTKKEIDAFVKAENKSNTAESKQLKGLLGAEGLQYAVADEKNVFTAQATKSTVPLTSLLAYTGTNSPIIQSNIDSAKQAVAQFQTLHGISPDYVKTQGGDVDVYSGLNPDAIYKALDNGLLTPQVTNGVVTGYTQSPEVIANQKQHGGFYSEELGIGKGASRELSLLTNQGTIIGGKANVQNVNGQYTVLSQDGADLLGTQKPLVDSGITDPNGNKIYTAESRYDTKNRKAGVTSVYVLSKDAQGNDQFTYSGSPDISYTRIGSPSFDLGGFVVRVGLSAVAMSMGVPALANNVIGPLLGVAGDSALAMGVAGSLVGGGISGATGQNILTGAALAGLGSAAYATITKALAQAGGSWEVLANNPSYLKDALLDTAPAAQVALEAAGGVEAVVREAAAQTVSDAAVASEAAASAAAGTPAVPEGLLDAGTNVSPGVDWSNVPSGGPGVDWSNIGAGGPGIDITHGALGDAAIQAISSNMSPDLAGLLTPAPPPISGADIVSPIWQNVGTPTTTDWSNVGGEAGKSISEQAWNYAKAHPEAAITAATGIGSAAVQALNPPSPPQDPPYTGPSTTLTTLTPTGLISTPPVTDWNQYYNNLFKRQGVGAGNYLGYDIQRGLGDIPPELMGLLGTGAPVGQTAGV